MAQECGPSGCGAHGTSSDCRRFARLEPGELLLTGLWTRMRATVHSDKLPPELHAPAKAIRDGLGL